MVDDLLVLPDQGSHKLFLTEPLCLLDLSGWHLSAEHVHDLIEKSAIGVNQVVWELRDCRGEMDAAVQVLGDALQPFFEQMEWDWVVADKATGGSRH
ncbi:MAG: hypothetical protein V2I33_19845, partial [Kangiellaceae bacterium]|nr:hypothetical protein [Kangiellaceae bacterium]